jgi:hypothetical protein
MESRAGLDEIEKRKLLTLLVLELDPSVIQPVASRCTNEIFQDYAFILQVSCKECIKMWYNIFITTIIPRFACRTFMDFHLL